MFMSVGPLVLSIVHGSRSARGPTVPVAAPADYGSDGGADDGAQTAAGDGDASNYGRSSFPSRRRVISTPPTAMAARYAMWARRTQLQMPRSAARTSTTPWYSGVHRTTACNQPG